MYMGLHVSLHRYWDRTSSTEAVQFITFCGAERGGWTKHNIRQTHETAIEMVRGSRVKQASSRRALPRLCDLTAY